MPPGKGTMCDLIMDYEAEELSPAQVKAYNSINEQWAAVTKKLEELQKSSNAQVEKLGDLTLVEFQGMAPTVNNASPPRVPGKKVILQPNPQNIVMVDQKAFNALLASSSAATVTSPSATTPIAGSSGSTIRVHAPTAPLPSMMAPVPQMRTPTPPRIRVRGGLSNTTPRGGGGTAFRQRTPSMVGRGRTAVRMTTPGILRQSQPTPQNILPKPVSDASNKNVIVDLTEEDQTDDANDVMSKADSKEVTISKNSDKTFPSLVVLARPFLGPKIFGNSSIQAERTALDEKVKQILTLGPSQLTEWLLQHGLLRSEQVCCAYAGRGKTHQPLKLGMYSDSSKFPYSGGYVWISECCPSQFVSVFSGSLFEAVPHPPTIIIKLIYHWACQTGVQNVIQWVKVDNLFVKNLYTNLRAVCTAAIHQKFQKFGGPGKRVQIGVISLGTTTQDGSSRQVKVEVLGVLDDESKMIRIRAIEPVPADPNLSSNEQMKKRFEKTLDLLPRWVDKASEIVIDYTVDKQTLDTFGYSKVIQVNPEEANANYKIMEYLRKIIPRMFQNTLSLLSRQIIQQFLDELSWRECYGPIPSRAFQSIVEHISEQTRLNSGGTLLNRLSRISLNPFKNWSYDKWAVNCKYVPPANKQQASSNIKTGNAASSTNTQAAGNRSNVLQQTKKVELSTPSATVKGPKPEIPSTSGVGAQKTSDGVDPTMIALEPYYYGVLEGDKKTKYVPFFTQCYFCRTDFKNALKLTDHLILHALNKNLDNNPDPKDVCRACLKIRLPGSKQHHQTQMCRLGPSQLGCRICALKMKDKGSLVYHMTKTHYQLDMPYRCDKCGYRVSEYDLLSQHYAKAHHNGVTGMCPFCLKIIDFATEEGGDLEQNQLFFTRHIQRHALPSSKKCSRCLLNFVNKSILAAHEVEMHASQEDNEDVMRFLVDDPTLMPAPIMEPTLAHAIQPGDMKPTGLLKGISTVLLGVSANVDPGIGVTCHECESPVTPDHFINYLMCNKCSFRTCCAHAMAEHVSLIHPPYPLSAPVYMGMKASISEKAYCSQCSFTSRDGNVMSQHLITCGSGSCYLGRKRTHRPSEPFLEVPPVKTRKKRGRKPRNWAPEQTSESESQESTSFQPQPKTILNSVGLVRKSTDEEVSQEPQENEPVAGPSGAGMEVDEGEEETIDASASLLEVSLVESPSGVDTGPDIVPVGDGEETGNYKHPEEDSPIQID